MADGFYWQILAGAIITLKLACCAVVVGMLIGVFGAILESIRITWLRYLTAGIIFIIRGLPELLVLFFIYFGLTAALSSLFGRYVNISSFAAGVTALGMIFGAYASEVFRGAFLAVDRGQIDAGRAVGFSSWQIFVLIQIPQAWRHAIPGLGNLWLILLKDTAIVSLIGLSEIMNQAKNAASTTHQPFTYYLAASLIYLVITSVSQQALDWFSRRANRYIHT